ncbi:MAG: FAD:protein FMN transferase [Planctomycetales bacterium]|nr:FAD:protein FMN transferase [Planctomycetales bacterium]
MSSTSLLLTLLIAQVAAPSGSDAQRLSRFEATETHMGTQVTITLYAQDEPAAQRGFAAAFARVAAVDRAMSDYSLESEVSRLSAASPTPEPVPVGDDLWRVLSASRQWSERTDGAFDVTIGPVSRLWRRARRQKSLPPEKPFAEARAAVGYEALRLDAATQSASLTRPNMRIDLGGIAKGYAVDAALAALRDAGINRALVNAGGDLAATDPPPDESFWAVGVRALRRDGPPTHFIRLNNNAVATSGDAWQYVEIDGVRYSHIIDPHTGLGLTHRSGVTIIAPDCMTADAAASAVSVLGPKKGAALILSHDKLEGMIATVENDQPHIWKSSGFDRLQVEGSPETANRSRE